MIGASLKYSQASLEKVQGNIVYYVKNICSNLIHTENILVSTLEQESKVDHRKVFGSVKGYHPTSLIEKVIF